MRMYDNDLKRNGSGYTDPTAFKAILNISKGKRKMEKYETPCRGDIYYIERGGTYKPAVIVSGELVNAENDVVEVVFLASRVTKELPTTVEIQLKQSSFAICEKITWFSVDKLGDYISSCTPDEMKAIDEALMISLGLNGSADVDDLTAEIASLKAKNEKAAEKYKTHVAECEEANKKLMSIINTREMEIQKLERECKALTERVPDIPAAELISLKTERDLYKTLYENMLDRMIRKETV